jgi:hypothetical protein
MSKEGLIVSELIANRNRTEVLFHDSQIITEIFVNRKHYYYYYYYYYYYTCILDRFSNSNLALVMKIFPYKSE